MYRKFKRIQLTGIVLSLCLFFVASFVANAQNSQVTITLSQLQECGRTTITATGDPAAGVTYTWTYTNGAAITETGSSITLNSPAYTNGTVTVTGRAAGYDDSSPVSEAVTIHTIPPPPTVARSVVFYQMEAGSVDISSDVGASAVAGNSIRWRNAGTSSTAPGTEVSPPMQSKAAEGTFYFWVDQYTPQNCFSNSVQVIVIISEVPAPKVQETSVCQGQPLTVNLATLVEPNPNPATYELVWHTLPAGGTGSTTPIDPATINTSAHGEQFVYVTYREIGDPTKESGRVPIKITVIQTPTVNAPANQTKCSGTATEAINFTGNTPSGVTYSWTNSNTAIGLAASGTGNIASFTATNSTIAPITATITVTSTVNSCPGTPVSFTITVNPTPTAGITNNTGTTVLTYTTPSISLTATGGVSFLWDNELGNNANATITNPGTYSVTVTNANGCTATASITITQAYTLTVTNGTDVTNTSPYPAGTVVSILAGSAPAGQVFDRWTSSGGGTFANANNASTTFTMPAGNVTVTANYRTPPTPPTISGTARMRLTTGYEATSTDAFTITGTTPVTITKTSGDSRITWNNATKKLDIAAGLPAGVYTVTLSATNNASSYTFTFTLRVENPVFFLEVPKSFAGGKVTTKSNNANPYLAEEGEMVTLTATPNEGYALDKIVVYMLGENFNIVTSVVIPLSGSGNIFTFIMPGHHITIVATFQNVRVGVEDVGVSHTPLRAYVQAGVLYVSGLTTGQQWNVYNMIGTLVYQGIADSDKAEVGLPVRGIYIVRCEDKAVKIIH